ncbi:MAG: TolC family protein, partial [Hyphomonadaceae bacterium]|nr:TolC family protein [Hyphomonadaceae bacterium]
GLAEARIALDAAQREAATARGTLASLIGADVGFALAAGDLGVPETSAHGHDADLDGSPDLALVRAARERASAELRLQRARGWQDPTLSLGVRRFEETGETGLVAGVSIPLGVFDRNGGAIARADADARRAGYDVEAERRRIERDAAALQRRLEGAASTVAAIERFVIPQAERALALARDGYNQGAFSYLDVLEAQRALTAAREARIEALRNYHHTEAALDRLTARFADAFGAEISQ